MRKQDRAGLARRTLLKAGLAAGMTVHANELYIAFRGDLLQPYTIKVYSFGGQLIRSFPVPSSCTQQHGNDMTWLELCSARDRLYLAESVPTGMDLCASLRTAERFEPAMMPVTLGKKSARSALKCHSTPPVASSSPSAGTTGSPALVVRT
mgnify:CR=1 FL=1